MRGGERSLIRPAFAAWIGLTPKVHSTAGKVRTGVITRAGDEGFAQRVGGRGYRRDPAGSTRRNGVALACRTSQEQVTEVGRRAAGQ